MNKINGGDVVVSNLSHEIKMTVSHKTDDGMFYCQYFDKENELHSVKFEEKDLTIVKME